MKENKLKLFLSVQKTVYETKHIWERRERVLVEEDYGNSKSKLARRLGIKIWIQIKIAGYRSKYLDPFETRKGLMVEEDFGNSKSKVAKCLGIKIWIQIKI